MLLHINVVCTMEFTKKDKLVVLDQYIPNDMRNVVEIAAQNVFLSLDVPSSFETSLALVFEDDVLDLRLVLKNALARILRLLHLQHQF